MSEVSWHTSSEATMEETAVEETVRLSWLKAMYVANILISLPIGLANLAAPETMRALLGIPAGDPVHFGIASGAIPLAFGMAGVLGLRSPLKLSPVLGLQVVYKTFYLIGVVLPLAVAGQVPGFAMPLTVLFVLFIIGDLIAIPFRYVLSPSPKMQ